MKRILIIATRQIGDVLLTTPLIRATRQRWPDARIDVLGFEGQMGMLAGNPDLNACIGTPPRLGLMGGLRLAWRLWRQYDLALISQPGDRAHILGWIAASCRTGLLPEQGSSNWWKQRLLAHAVTSAGDLGSVHVVPEKLQLLAPWTRASQETPPIEVIPPASRPLPEDIQAVLRPGYLVVHAPSMWTYKQWPLAHFSQLIRHLLDRGWQVVLTGSGSVRDQECLAALRPLGESPHLVDVSGRLDFGQIHGLLASAGLFLGPDTSVTHLAAAAGTPTVAIFGPTNPQRWGPWPKPIGHPAFVDGFQRSAPRQSIGCVTVLQSGHACVPCGRAGCEDHLHSRSDCLSAIEAPVVLEQIEALLGNTAQFAPSTPQSPVQT